MVDFASPERYRPIRELGSGGGGVVYLAEDSALGRHVAVKQLYADHPEEVAQRFQREARLGAALNHPNVVTVFDAVSESHGLFIVMEYVEGPSLADLLDEGPLEPERALSVLRGVAAALDHVHAHGVVHRDLKPANVLLAPDGTPKLADLGIATAVESTRITAPGIVVGTAAYVSPEQVAGEQVSPASDIYSLAALGFEMLSGRRARNGTTVPELVQQALGAPPPDLRDHRPGTSRQAADTLRRGLARDPGERPASAGELVEELTEGMRKGGERGGLRRRGRGRDEVSAGGSGAPPRSREGGPGAEPREPTGERPRGDPSGPRAEQAHPATRDPERPDQADRPSARGRASVESPASPAASSHPSLFRDALVERPKERAKAGLWTAGSWVLLAGAILLGCVGAALAVTGEGVVVGVGYGLVAAALLALLLGLLAGRRSRRHRALAHGEPPRGSLRR